MHWNITYHSLRNMYQEEAVNSYMYKIKTQENYYFEYYSYPSLERNKSSNRHENNLYCTASTHEFPQVSQ